MRAAQHPHSADDPWLLVETALDPARLHAGETAFTIGNGRFATRGSFEEGYPGSRPATLAHGMFAPHPLAFTELANLPDWPALDVVVDGERFDQSRGTLEAYRRELDLRTGLLRRDVTWRSPGGRRLRLELERFASLADPWLAAVRVQVTALDGPCRIEARASLDDAADTEGRAHLVLDEQHVDGRSASLGVHLRGTDTRIGMAMDVRLHGATAEHEAWDARGRPTLVARWHAEPGVPVTVDKVVALATSGDAEVPVAAAGARVAAVRNRPVDALYEASAAAWDREWSVADVRIEGDAEAQLAARFSIYQLLIAAPRSNEQVSIGAKTLSGFGYRGHVFWDTEAFMLPFFTHTQPAVARNLLSYRWHRLPGARRKAAANGHEGAQFPWESADTGDEVTPPWLPDADDPARLVRIWTGDVEIHISACIAQAVIRYWQATADDAFMAERGAELVIDTARFWASRAEWDEAGGCYRFRDVIGPDEYHDHVDDNAFTNYLAAWHLRAAADVVPWLVERAPERAADLVGPAREAEELAARFRRVAEAVYLPHDAATGLVEQFRGYLDLPDADIDAHAHHRRSMQSLLGIEGVARTRVIKQPDVLMLVPMLPDLFDERTIAANYAFYTPRTDHAFGSSLGPAIGALLAARMGEPEDAYRKLMLAARADLGDVRGNAADGVHGASAGGLWQALVFGFAGVRFRGDEVTTDPCLPAHWTRLAFSIVHRGRVERVDLRRTTDDEADERAA